MGAGRKTRALKIVKPFVQYNAFSGVVFAAKGDRVLVQKAYGMANYEFGVPNTMDTRFAIASISAPISSTSGHDIRSPNPTMTGVRSSEVMDFFILLLLHVLDLWHAVALRGSPRGATHRAARTSG